MFSFNGLRASTCTFLVLLVVGMISSVFTLGGISGGVIDIDVNSDLVQNYASLGLEEYAKDKSYEPTIVQINSATEQYVSGKLYKINVTFGGQSGETDNCIVNVLSQPWRDNGNPKVTVDCE